MVVGRCECAEVGDGGAAGGRGGGGGVEAGLEGFEGGGVGVGMGREGWHGWNAVNLYPSPPRTGLGARQITTIFGDGCLRACFVAWNYFLRGAHKCVRTVLRAETRAHGFVRAACVLEVGWSRGIVRCGTRLRFAFAGAVGAGACALSRLRGASLVPPLRAGEGVI